VFIDSRKLRSGTTVQADVCVIGGGIAGITLALELLESNKSVVLLESGGLEADEKTTDLSRGKNVGRGYLKLAETRRRFWGGSSNAWAGLVAPLTAQDFERREWVPHSGWPMGRADLEPFYKRAYARLGLPGYRWTAEDHATDELPALDFGEGSRIQSHVLQGVVGRRRMGVLNKDLVEASKTVRVHLHANVKSIELNPGGTAVDHLAVQVLGGPSFKAKAKTYVLATGGLENPRILLASNSVQKKGVGNGNDLVGRYFMEHTHTNDQGFLAGSPAMADWHLYRRNRYGEELEKHSIWAHFAVTPAVRKQEKLLACNLVLLAEKGRRKKKRLKRAVPLKTEMLAATASTDGDGSGPAAAASKLRFTFGTPAESAPNPDSRVTLSAEGKDALGTPRLELNWKLSSIDKRSIRRSHEILAREVGRAGLGRVQLTLTEDDEEWPRMSGGRHHMGTTRMNADPKQGVCDANGQIHGVGNLYVAGSSLFPTCGAAPPTLTLMALATRLADRIKEA
jgi:choline dehydrogenase-like flavoprotein